VALGAVIEIDLPDVPGGSQGLTGVFEQPAGEGPWPGVVLVHEAYGVTDVMRRQVSRLAQAGYLALMPDLFSQGGSRRCLVATMRSMRTGEGRAYLDIENARAVLAARPDCTGAVGIIGFCMGGGFALVSAVGHGFDVASANYGYPPRDLDDDLRGACPIVGSYGALDHSQTGVAAKLEASLTRLGVPHDIKEYPNAGHSFLNDAESGPAAVRLLTKRILGAGPEPESATDAWRRIEAFFAEYLGGRPRG
jgi:carboxymethylenebutenolidase